jgi:hypothetical protein
MLQIRSGNISYEKPRYEAKHLRYVQKRNDPESKNFAPSTVAQNAVTSLTGPLIREVPESIEACRGDVS